MKSFIHDYLELCKHSIGFIKKHWIGCLIYYILLVAVYIFSLFGGIELIIDAITDFKSRRKAKKSCGDNE